MGGGRARVAGGLRTGGVPKGVSLTGQRELGTLTRSPRTLTVHPRLPPWDPQEVPRAPVVRFPPAGRRRARGRGHGGLHERRRGRREARTLLVGGPQGGRGGGRRFRFRQGFGGPRQQPRFEAGRDGCGREAGRGRQGVRCHRGLPQPGRARRSARGSLAVGRSGRRTRRPGAAADLGRIRKQWFRWDADHSAARPVADPAASDFAHSAGPDAPGSGALRVGHLRAADGSRGVVPDGCRSSGSGGSSQVRGVLVGATCQTRGRVRMVIDRLIPLPGAESEERRVARTLPSRG